MITSLPMSTVASLRGFLRNQDGVSAVEFAMILPLMITLYLGCVEVTQAVSADRKTTLVAHTVGDLVAQDQNSCVTDADIDKVFVAATAVLHPFEGGKLDVVVTSVLFDNNKKATVAWSKTFHNGVARKDADTSVIPDALKVAGSSLIWAEASYTYEPMFGAKITGQKTLTDQIYLRPRLNNPVAKKTSCS